MTLRQLFEGFKAGFAGFSHSIGLGVNAAVLTAVYIIGIGITSLLARLVGKKFLRDEKRDSYWVRRNLGKKGGKYYRKMY